ncbi:response regulator [Vreelandella olivaria]|uniref:response regulator n=1 Tax=Vreelandella olivaria TaxID=390919 RepID=UPI00201EA2AC|nr:response regulator [Halomonas olivaria]
MATILVIDDDIDLLDLMRDFLTRHGFKVETACSGKTMDQRMEHTKFDMLILDIMLPDEDGIAICKRIREHSNISIIMLTAITELPDRILGLELGADDYVAKPFDPRELLARIRAVLRRTSQRSYTHTSTPHFHFNNWKLEIGKRELRNENNTLIPISGGEFELLLTFVNHPGKVLSRNQILDLTKGATYDVFDRSIDVLISRLRRKIEPNPKYPKLIKTVRNSGYIFTPLVYRK